MLGCYGAFHYCGAEANIPCRAGYLRPERLQLFKYHYCCNTKYLDMNSDSLSVLYHEGRHSYLGVSTAPSLELIEQQWRTEGVEVWGDQTPPPRNSEGPPKLYQTQPDCEKLLKIAEFRTPTPQDVRKRGSKILKLPRFAIVLLSNDR